MYAAIYSWVNIKVGLQIYTFIFVIFTQSIWVNLSACWCVVLGGGLRMCLDLDLGLGLGLGLGLRLGLRTWSVCPVCVE